LYRALADLSFSRGYDRINSSMPIKSARPAAILPARHWSYPWIAMMAGAVMLARSVAVICTFNHTIDEPYHIGSAMVLYEAHKLTAGAQHPPLARLVAGLPLMLQGVRLPVARGEYIVVEYPAFEIGQNILFSGQLSYWRMLISARLALLIFPILAMFYIYRLGRWLGNSLIAMLATVFFSVDPTFHGHSTWIGTDSAACAGFIAGMYYGLRFIASPNWTRAIALGVALGLAVACKYSCLLLIPALIVIVAMRVIIKRRFRPRRAILWKTIAVCVIAFVSLWATYLFDIAPLRFQAMFSDQKIWTNLPAALRETPIPMPSFWLGYLFLSARSAAGHATYLNGQVSFSGWRQYFPVALLVKSSIGFLAALSFAIATLMARRRMIFRSLALLMPSVIYIALSMSGHYQLGIRHLLPILPLLYIFIIQQLSRGRLIWLLLGAIFVAMLETAAIHPDYLPFFNMISGGPSRGERYLIDSNLDWGQDIYRLAQWLKTDANGRRYSIGVFNASAPLLKELQLDPASLSGQPRGLLAISKNVKHRLEGAIQNPDGSIKLGPDYTWVEKYPLVKHIGYSIDVYDMDRK
jgi:hypothetical protein